jgi:glycosyltransferase involved in cell wall biosynthesis
MPDYVFVLEQTLGHAAHARNLERVVAAEPDVEGTFLHLEYGDRLAWQRLPGLGSWSLRSSWAARQGLRRILAERTPDAIFIHTQVASLLAIQQMRRVPSVVSLDATPINFDEVGAPYSHRTAGGAIEAAKMVANRRSYAAAAGLVTWSRWAADSLRNDYAVPDHKIRVIPPGVDLDIFMPAYHRPHARVRLLFVGGDLERKGGLDLLQALPALGDRVELDLVTGSEPPAIPTGATVRVHRGLRPQSPELVRLYREADIFVLPTHADTLAQVIAEAMACALPVISSPVGAVAELVHDRVTGLLVPPGSPAELAQALRSLSADPSRMYELGQAGLELVRREHDAGRNNRSILGLMHQISERPVSEAMPA